MVFKPDYSYDAEERIWSGMPARNYFSADQSIGEIIFREMQRHPKHTAQISFTETTVLTYEELHLNSMRVASYMRNLGMAQSDIVGIIGRNTTHIFAVAYACFFNGIAFHSININFEESLINKLLDITKPRLIFCDGEEYEKIKSATANLNVKIITMRNHHKDSISIDDVLATPVEIDFKPYRLEHGIDQTLAILCTSGTTGISKAVTISNSHKIFDYTFSLTIDDIQYTESNLDWQTGLVTMITSAVFGTTRIISDKTFDPARTLSIIEKYKVAWILHAPTHMAVMVNCKEFEKANLQSIRYYVYGGGRCALEVQNSIRSSLRFDCLNMVYGFSEVGVVSANWNFDEKPTSVGRLLNGFRIKIINEQGENLGPNEVGEICVHNGQYWAGYYGNPEETQIIRDSRQWFYSGDLGYMDDDGFLYAMDPKKDLLRYQGVMYYPSDVEQIISEMPGVAEVCVFGIWNKFNGEEAAAAVVKKVGSQINAQDVVKYVESHTEGKYKHLHGGALIVDDLIRSPNGKTNRIATKAFFS